MGSGACGANGSIRGADWKELLSRLATFTAPIGPLLRSRVLPLFPAAWHDDRPIGDPEDDLAKLALEWK